VSIDLPGPISAYFEASNKHDIDGMLAPFDEDASVKDEGQEHHGRPTIRSWLEDVTRKYRVTIDVKDVTDANGKTVVSGLVSGNFPGSPVLLDHAFTLSGPKITRLEIA
jgi:ketosteroid isomerase-like protein